MLLQQVNISDGVSVTSQHVVKSKVHGFLVFPQYRIMALPPCCWTFLLKGETMKVRQIVEAGSVTSVYVSYTDELELGVEGGDIRISLSEDTMKQIHQRLGERLTSLAERRLKDAQELLAENE